MSLTIIQDPHFGVHTIGATPNPQTLVYLALHQDYSENAVYDCTPPSEQKCGEIAVDRCIKYGHWGVLEHPQISFNVVGFPHSVMQQARTHRTGISFDVQCLTGDTKVTFVDKKGQACATKTLSDLYDLWSNGEKAERERKIRGRKGEPPGIYRRDCKKRIRKMGVRSLDEDSNTFVVNHIEDVLFKGLQPVYKVTLEDGKEIRCTQNHQIYTLKGWQILANLDIGDSVMVNGIAASDAPTTYQDMDWLKTKLDSGLRPKDIARELGCSTEVVKKWAYRFNLTWDKSVWNQGKTYSLNLSMESRQAKRDRMREINKQKLKNNRVPSGASHPSWKNLPVEKRVYNWLKYERAEIIQSKGGKCSHCGSPHRLHVHHIEPVRNRPDLAFDKSNLELLCASCHSRHHHRGTSNPLCAHPQKIIAIEYLGVMPTYDLVMQDPHRNFVGNGIVVHNSGRYSGKRFCQVASGEKDIEEVIYFRPVGFYTDRQGKRYEYTQEDRDADKRGDLESCKEYDRKMKRGFSEEHARGRMPFDFRQNFVVSANLRTWLHLLDMRFKPDAQAEIQTMMHLAIPRLQEWAPQILDWYIKNRSTKGRLAP